MSSFNLLIALTPGLVAGGFFNKKGLKLRKNAAFGAVLAQLRAGSYQPLPSFQMPKLPPPQPFTFRGFTFRPHRKLTAAESRQRGEQSAWRNYNNQGREASPVLRSREAGWDYEAFYEAARAANSGEFDLYFVDGKGETQYLPTTAYLSILPRR